MSSAERPASRGGWLGRRRRRLRPPAGCGGGYGDRELMSCRFEHRGPTSYLLTLRRRKKKNPARRPPLTPVYAIGNTLRKKSC